MFRGDISYGLMLVNVSLTFKTFAWGSWSFDDCQMRWSSLASTDLSFFLHTLPFDPAILTLFYFFVVVVRNTKSIESLTNITPHWLVWAKFTLYQMCWMVVYKHLVFDCSLCRFFYIEKFYIENINKTPYFFIQKLIECFYLCIFYSRTKCLY